MIPSSNKYEIRGIQSEGLYILTKIGEEHVIFSYPSLRIIENSKYRLEEESTKNNTKCKKFGEFYR